MLKFQGQIYLQFNEGMDKDRYFTTQLAFVRLNCIIGLINIWWAYILCRRFG